MNKILKNSLRAILSVGICLSSTSIFSVNWIVRFINRYDQPVKVRSTETGKDWNRNIVNEEPRGASDFIIPAKSELRAKDFALPWHPHLIKVDIPPKDKNGAVIADKYNEYRFYEVSGWIHTGNYRGYGDDKEFRRAIGMIKERVSKETGMAEEPLGSGTDFNNKSIGDNWELKVLIHEDGRLEVRGLREELYTPSF